MIYHFIRYLILVSCFIPINPMVFDGQFHQCSVSNPVYWDQELNCDSFLTQEPEVALYQMYHKKPDINGNIYECIMKKITYFPDNKYFSKNKRIDVKYIDLNKQQCQSLVKSKKCHGIIFKSNYVLMNIVQCFIMMLFI